LIRTLSAGPGMNWSGLIMEGFMGRDEFGSMAGSQFAAGRSCQGTLASPCMAGMMKGASLAAFPFVIATAPVAPFEPEAACEAGASRITSRSLSVRADAKYLCSSHRFASSDIFFVCFGQSAKAAALSTSAGRKGSTTAQKPGSWRRTWTWYSTSLRT
jgi:hypothetical protein